MHSTRRHLQALAQDTLGCLPSESTSQFSIYENPPHAAFSRNVPKRWSQNLYHLKNLLKGWQLAHPSNNAYKCPSMILELIHFFRKAEDIALVLDSFIWRLASWQGLGSEMAWEFWRYRIQNCTHIFIGSDTICLGTHLHGQLHCAPGCPKALQKRSQCRP